MAWQHILCPCKRLDYGRNQREGCPKPTTLLEEPGPDRKLLGSLDKTNSEEESFSIIEVGTTTKCSGMWYLLVMTLMTMVDA